MFDPSGVGYAKNKVLTLGLYACAENDQTQASGNSSRAEGVQTIAGDTPQAFTIGAGGTVVTITGDVRAFFTNGDMVRIKPGTPLIREVVSRTVASVPAFAAGNTTFSISSAIDATTTGGQIVDSVHGAGAHAEGSSTAATGDSSHAEGSGSQAMGFTSHAEGNGTTATGAEAHSEGNGTAANGDASHAEGSGSVASGNAAHAEGGGTTAEGTAAHTEGNGTVARGEHAHAEGNESEANANASHAEGVSSRAGDEAQSFTIGAGGVTVTIAGDVTAFFANGDTVRVAPTAPDSLNPLTRTVASVPAFGGGNTTFDISSAIDATTTDGTIVDVSRGTGAHAEGNTAIATGLAAHAEGGTCTASGAQAHAEGSGCVASGPQCHAEGVSCTASGNPGSHAEGRENTASGDNGAHAEGYNGIASGPSSHTEGFGGLATENAAHARNFNCRAMALGASASGWGAVTGATGQGHVAEEVRGGGEAFGGFAHGGIQSGAVTYHVEVASSDDGDLADALGTAAWRGEDDFNYTFWIEITVANPGSPATAGQSMKLKVDAHQTGGVFVVDGQTASEGTDPGAIGASVVATAVDATMVLTVTNILESPIRVVANLRWNALSTT